MSEHIFISDLHLSEDRPDLTRAFFQFLDDIFPAHEKTNPQSLYILGDLFDVWLGDDDKRPFNLSITERLAQVSASKFIMHGNRDFLIGSNFCNAINATLLDDPTLHEFDSHPVLLMHGDSLCTLDEKYMQARAQFRSPEFQAEFLGKTLAERAAYAENIRDESKRHTQQQLRQDEGRQADDIMDVTPDEVTRVMSAQRAATLIHGHTHRPGTHSLEVNGSPATRYVLGDWHKSTWYLAMRDGQANLIHYTF